MNFVFEGAQGYKLLDSKSVTEDPGTFVQSSRYTEIKTVTHFYISTCLTHHIKTTSSPPRNMA